MVKRILIFLLIVGTALLAINLQKAIADTEFVTVIYATHDKTSVIEFKNSEENIFNINSFVLEIDKSGLFKSFKTENGWIGKKTSSGNLIFTATHALKPGETAKFGIKADNDSPIFNWKAIDEEGDEIASGNTLSKISSTDNKIQGQKGILDNSDFKIIPSTLKAGSSFRVIGEAFAANARLDFYVGNSRIESFVTDGSGSFILSTKIPDNQLPDRTDFVIKDQAGNQKLISLRIEPFDNRPTTENIVLTIQTEPIYHRGDDQIISGTANPGSTLTVSIIDSNNKTLTTFTTKADNTGKYSINQKIPSDKPYGEYTVKITDGKSTVSDNYKVETSQQIILVSQKEKYELGETVVINGTAIPNQEVEIIVKDSVGREVYSGNILPSSNGTFTLTYPVPQHAIEGTYILFAIQGNNRETHLIGIGELPSPQLIMTSNSLNYKTSEKVVLDIMGEPSATANLIIIDPSDHEKFSDSIIIGEDGFFKYTFSLTGYSPGIYTAVLTRGNTQVEQTFSVGLTTSSGPITVRTVSETYLPGEPILILGNSNPNSIITVTLKDPNGTKIKSADVFTDKTGVFTLTTFRFPINAKVGVWILDAASGTNHDSKELIILTEQAEGLSIRVDKNPPIYKINDFIQISGTGASKSANLQMTILGINQTKVTSLQIVAKADGSFATMFQIKPEFSGKYTLKVFDGTKTAETTFSVG